MLGMFSTNQPVIIVKDMPHEWFAYLCVWPPCGVAFFPVVKRMSETVEGSATTDAEIPRLLPERP